MCTARNGFGSEATKLIKITVHGECCCAGEISFVSIVFSAPLISHLKQNKTLSISPSMRAEPARISTKYKAVETRVDERAQLVCSASGELPISVTWFDRDSKQVDKQDKRFV